MIDKNKLKELKKRLTTDLHLLGTEIALSRSDADMFVIHLYIEQARNGIKSAIQQIDLELDTITEAASYPTVAQEEA